MLSLRERQIMLLCNGAREKKDLLDLFGDAVEAQIDGLVQRGLLTVGKGDEHRNPQGPIREKKPQVVQAIAQAATLAPHTDFMASQIDSRFPEGPLPNELTPLGEEEQRDLAMAKANAKALRLQPRQHFPKVDLMSWAEGKPVAERSVMKAKNFMTQVLLALKTPSAMELVNQNASVRHEVDVLIYLAHAVNLLTEELGQETALHIALFTSQRLPESAVPVWLDCTLDYLPMDVSMLLYEMALAGRDMPG